MSWLFSRALVVEYSAEAFWVGEPCALLNGESTPQAYCAPDKMKDFSRLSRFGMTFKPLMGDHGADLLMWYRAGFRAKTSALQEKAKALPESAPGCGPTWRASLAKFDPDSRSWKTVQLSLLGDSELSSVTWPRSGMTADGECWELPMLERTTSATGFGLWQTPVADDAVNRAAGKWNSRGEPKLSAQVMQWPTPNARDFKGSPGAGCMARGGRQSSLPAAVKTWPTPRMSDYKGATSVDAMQKAADRGFSPNLPEAVAAAANGGQMNPTWVEWLMGWPLGWTALKPLEMDKFREWLQQHGNYLVDQ